MAKKNYRRRTLTIEEKQELACMRSEVVRIEAMLLEGIISTQEYNKAYRDMLDRISALEAKYDIQ